MNEKPKSAAENKESCMIPLSEETFRFACHPSISCFTDCCRDLRLVLTPYDIIRLRKHLEISAKEFLDTYTVSEFTEQTGLPMVLLKMQDNDQKTCPFVSAQGCAVYEDRPGACRMYPIGRAAQKHSFDVGTREQYFVVKESHCVGFQEDKEWTIKEWLDDQGLNEYNALNDYWTEIVTSNNPRRHGGIDEKKAQMFYLASYNIDMFRKFVLSAQFSGRFDLEESLQESLKNDDIELMKFAMQWLKFSLFGEGTFEIKDDALRKNLDKMEKRQQ